MSARWYNGWHAVQKGLSLTDPVMTKGRAPAGKCLRSRAGGEHSSYHACAKSDYVGSKIVTVCLPDMLDNGSQVLLYFPDYLTTCCIEGTLSRRSCSEQGQRGWATAGQRHGSAAGEAQLAGAPSHCFGEG